MSISISAQKLSSPTFLKDALTQEVNRLLSRDYARASLEAFEAHPEGLTTRWIDIRVVGLEGSAKSAYEIVKDFLKIGWLAPKGGKKAQLWILTERGKAALEYARQGDSVENEAAGDH